MVGRLHVSITSPSVNIRESKYNNLDVKVCDDGKEVKLSL
jgi:hypothetical protein